MPTGVAVKVKPKKKSVLKRIRQTERRTTVNRANRTRVRTVLKRLRAAIAAGNATEAERVLGATLAALDKAIQKGVLHENTANRYKSRLTLAVQGMKAA